MVAPSFYGSAFQRTAPPSTLVMVSDAAQQPNAVTPVVARPSQLSLFAGSWTAEQLREWVVAELELAGFRHEDGQIHLHEDLSKEAIRRLHWRQRQAVLAAHRPFVLEWEEKLIGFFANGEEVDPRRVRPRVVPVATDEQAALFRYASLFWSVPVSGGYGRRSRFLVIDDSNDYLIGIFALGDPVYNLTARDAYVGWNVTQRSKRLYNVLDAFVVGAVPPYRELLGGKMVAMAAASDEAREFIAAKYDGTTTHISGATKDSRPVLVTTTSSLGRSSIYNRLRFNDRLLFEPVGFSVGYGHFQFSDDLFRALVDYLPDNERPGNEYGKGPNWKIRALRKALNRVGLDEELLRHGVRRQVFIAPLATNWKEYLRGETDRPRWRHHRVEDLGRFWVRRWCAPRARRDESYSFITRDSMRLSRSLDVDFNAIQYRLSSPTSKGDNSQTSDGMTTERVIAAAVSAITASS